MKTKYASLHIINGNTQMLDFCLGRCKNIHRKRLKSINMLPYDSDDYFCDKFYSINNDFAISIYGNCISYDNVQQQANLYFYDFQTVYVLAFAACEDRIILSLSQGGKIQEELSIAFQENYSSYLIKKNTMGVLFDSLFKLSADNVNELLSGESIDVICSGFSAAIKLPLTLTYAEISNADELTKDTDIYGAAYLKYGAEFHSFCLI